MIKKIGILIICIITVILFCWFIVFPYFINDYQPPETKYIGSGYISLNPDTILNDLESGVTVFDKEIENPSEGNSFDNSNNSKVFSEDEFMYISNRFVEIHWQDNLSEWNLIDVEYVLYDCEKGMYGNVSAKYIYEKTNESEKKTIQRTVIIVPWKSAISWNEKVIEDTLFSPEIDWNKVNIKAVDAFEISREYGDTHLGEGWDLSCDEASIQLVNKSNNIWSIDYLGTTELLLEIEINVKTGKVKE